MLLGWRLWWCAVSRLAFVVACRAVLAVRAGEGGGLILAALTKSAPTLPSPPRHPVTARCAAGGVGERNTDCLLLPGCIVFLTFRFLACPRIPAQAHTGSTGQGVSRPTISARSVRRTAHPLNGRSAKQRHPNLDRPTYRQTAGQAVMSDASLPRGQNENGWVNVKLGACSTIAPGSVQLLKDNPIFPSPICRKRLCPILQS